MKLKILATCLLISSVPIMLCATEDIPDPPLQEVFKAGCGDRAASQARAYFYFLLAQSLEQGNRAGAALQAYQLVEECDTGQDMQIVENFIRLLEIWLSDGEIKPELIENYLRAQNFAPPPELILFFRFSDSGRYSEAKALFSILAGGTRQELERESEGEESIEEKPISETKNDIRKELWKELPMLYLRGGNESKALAIMAEKQQITQPAKQFLKLAEISEELENYQQASAYLKKSQALEKSDLEALNLIDMYEKQDLIDEAVKEWQQLLSRSGDQRGYILFADFLFKHGRKEEAILTARLIIKKADGNASITVGAAKLLAECGLYTEAIPVMQAAIKQKPINLQMRLSLVKVLRQSGNMNAAIAELKKAEAIFVGSNSLSKYELELLGNAWQEAGELLRAAKAHERARETTKKRRRRR